MCWSKPNAVIVSMHTLMSGSSMLFHWMFMSPTIMMLLYSIKNFARNSVNSSLNWLVIALIVSEHGGWYIASIVRVTLLGCACQIAYSKVLRLALPLHFTAMLNLCTITSPPPCLLFLLAVVMSYLFFLILLLSIHMLSLSFSHISMIIHMSVSDSVTLSMTRVSLFLMDCALSSISLQCFWYWCFLGSVLIGTDLRLNKFADLSCIPFGLPLLLCFLFGLNWLMVRHVSLCRILSFLSWSTFNFMPLSSLAVYWIAVWTPCTGVMVDLFLF